MEEMLESENREVALVVKDEDNYMLEGLTIDQRKFMLCKQQKRDSITVIKRLQIKLKKKS